MYVKKIIHTSLYQGGNGSEYIKPRGRINITSHGLGSGIYGLTSDKLLTSPSFGGFEYKFEIENAFLINTDDELEKYSELSKNLMYMFENMLSTILNNNIYNEDDEILNIFYKNMINKIELTYPGIFDKKKLMCNLRKFVNDYLGENELIEMPINYVLRSGGWDGVYSDNTYLNSWSRGNVKFLDLEDRHGIRNLGVCNLLIREGIGRINIKI